MYPHEHMDVRYILNETPSAPIDSKDELYHKNKGDAIYVRKLKEAIEDGNPVLIHSKFIASSETPEAFFVKIDKFDDETFTVGDTTYYNAYPKLIDYIATVEKSKSDADNIAELLLNQNKSSKYKYAFLVKEIPENNPYDTTTFNTAGGTGKLVSPPTKALDAQEARYIIFLRNISKAVTGSFTVSTAQQEYTTTDVLNDILQSGLPLKDVIEDNSKAESSGRYAKGTNLYKMIAKRVEENLFSSVPEDKKNSKEIKESRKEWMNSYRYQIPAIIKAIKENMMTSADVKDPEILSKFIVYRDHMGEDSDRGILKTTGEDNASIMHKISKFIKDNFKIAQKDSWNPADIWVVRKDFKDHLDTKIFHELSAESQAAGFDAMMKEFNDRFRKNKTNILGFSLKKVGAAAHATLMNFEDTKIDPTQVLDTVENSFHIDASMEVDRVTIKESRNSEELGIKPDAATMTLASLSEGKKGVKKTNHVPENTHIECKFHVNKISLLYKACEKQRSADDPNSVKPVQTPITEATNAEPDDKNFTVEGTFRLSKSLNFGSLCLEFRERGKAKKGVNSQCGKTPLDLWKNSSTPQALEGIDRVKKISEYIKNGKVSDKAQFANFVLSEFNTISDALNKKMKSLGEDIVIDLGAGIKEFGQLELSSDNENFNYKTVKGSRTISTQEPTQDKVEIVKANDFPIPPEEAANKLASLYVLDSLLKKLSENSPHGKALKELSTTYYCWSKKIGDLFGPYVLINV